MKKYYWFIYIVYIFFYFQISSFYFNPVYDLFIDYSYYNSAVKRLWSNDKLYQNGFVYFTSFFILTPFLLNIYIYLALLCVSLIFSFFLLLQLEDNYWNIIFFIMLPILYIYNGNIDPFIFLIVLICCYYQKNEYIPPILLAFVSFKPTIILIIPYFFFNSNNKAKFYLYYIAFFLLFNFYMILNYTLFFELLRYELFEHRHFIDITRPYWIYYTYYFGLRKKYKKQELLTI